MKGEIFMVLVQCFYCKKFEFYNNHEELYFCKKCGRNLIEKGIAELVFVLNHHGIKTERSCEGNNDFESGCYQFPWITLANEEDAPALEEATNAYNKRYCIFNPSLSKWKVDFNFQVRKFWILPEETQKKSKNLQEESEYLAWYLDLTWNLHKIKKGK